MLPLASSFRDSLAKGQKPDLKALDEIVKREPKSGPGDACLFVAYFLIVHGYADDALEWLDRCATAPETLPLYRAVAISLLRDRGAEPGKVKRRAAGG